MPGARISHWAARHWLWMFSVGWGVVVGLPFLAPVFMQVGWPTAGRAIYTLYSFFCHQLPQRSFFLFGPKPMFSLADLQAFLQSTADPIVLRQFIGNDQLGWKVAWSDRMVSMYTAMLPVSWIWYIFRKHLGELPTVGFALLLLPMGLDGGSHLLSDLAGLGQGFRDSNTWLADLTGSVFPAWFYAGDAWGSFNSIMRIGTGVLFAIGVVWFIFPYLEEAFLKIRTGYETRFNRLEALGRELEGKIHTQ